MSLWTTKASTVPWLKEMRPRKLSPAEVAELRADAQRREDESPFRCECLACRLRRRT